MSTTFLPPLTVFLDEKVKQYPYWQWKERSSRVE